jgi:hypothetical protein
MRPQVYNIDRAEGELGRVFLREAVQRFRPGLASQMAESFSSAMEYNTVGYVYDLVKGMNDDSPVIEKEMWNYENHENFRQGIPFREGLTEDQAFVEAERYDRDRTRSEYMANTNPWDLHNLGAAFSAAIFDPLSYVPMVGLGSKAIGISAKISQRMGTVANVATKMNPIKSFAIGAIKPLKPIAVYGAEGALGESAYQIIRASSEASNGKDFDYMGAMLDVSIATVFGSALGTIPVARTIKKNFTEKQQLIAIAKATHDFKQHGEVQLDGASPLGEGKHSKVETEINYKEEMDELRTSERHKLNKDLHPIVEHLNSIGEDLTVGVNKLINRFRDCQ